MSKPSFIPIILLYTRNYSPVDGATRFQKLIFLAQEESKLPQKYDYEAYKFGPYSWKLESDLEAHIAQGNIQRKTVYNGAGNPKYRYSLTPKGIQFAQKLLNRVEPVFSELQDIKGRYNNWQIGDLLGYVYGNYPDYTTETELDLDNLFDPEAASQFLDSENEEGPGFNHLDELESEIGEITASGESFERTRLASIRDKQLCVEKFGEGQISVYWPSDMNFDAFLKCVDEDNDISEDSPCEMRSVERGEWNRGTHASVTSELDDLQGCLFYAVASNNSDYEVTWERGVAEDDHNEITILFTPDENRDTSMVRSTLTTYLGPDIHPVSQIEDLESISLSNDDIRESLWETTRYILA